MSVKVLPLQFDRQRQLRRDVVEPGQVRHRQLRDVFLGNRLALHVGRVVVLQGGRLGQHQHVGPQGIHLPRHGHLGVVGDVLDRHDHRDSQQDRQEAGRELALALEDFAQDERSQSHGSCLLVLMATATGAATRFAPP